MASVRDNWTKRMKKIEQRARFIRNVLGDDAQWSGNNDLLRDAIVEEMKSMSKKLTYLADNVKRGTCDIREE